MRGPARFFFSLLSTDQGVRGVCQVTNDVLFTLASDLDLASWRPQNEPGETEDVELRVVSEELKAIPTQIRKFIRELSHELAHFDWRTSATPKLPEAERRAQAAFRGSGGYRELRLQLTQLLSASQKREIATAAREILAKLEPKDPDSEA
jgi:hypothetical protein